MKLLRNFAIIVAMFALFLSISASAQGKTESGLQEIQAVDGRQRGQDSADPAGIGAGVYAKFNLLSLFQCPYTNCNQGWVNEGFPLPADDVAAICQYPGWKSPRGNNWVLLLSHQNNHVGFADIGDVVAQNGSFSPPAC
ncbi:hypothetical protein [Amycolatopsis sp. cmx-11-12]|uniref:hypothetical protein n=1 Tax=Amycolatopsis sp. cmx-11-12 TaxID=2785795 RepID=UPI00391705EB